MKLKILFSLIIIATMLNLAKAQKLATLTIGKYDTIKVATINYEGEIIPWLVLNEVIVREYRIFKTPLDKAKFNRLRYNVLKVLPYARYAGERYRKLERDLALTNDKKIQRRLVKGCETEIKQLFNSKIKDMSINQGEILIKLIDRETGSSSYGLVKDIQGSLPAFFMQSLARLFGHNLKTEYNTEEERDIESIINSAGYYTYQ